MRWLFFADLVITALIAALLLTSPATFAYYRFGWLALVGIALLVFVLARRRSFWLLIALSALGLPVAWIALPAHFGALDLLLILWAFGALPLISAGLIGSSIAPPRYFPRRELLIAVVALGVFVNLRSIHAFPNFSATDEAIIFNYVDTFERTGKIEASLVPYDAPTVTGNLYVYAAALWLRLFPDDPFALRALSALGSLALIVVVFLAARALSDTLDRLDRGGAPFNQLALDRRRSCRAAGGLVSSLRLGCVLALARSSPPQIARAGAAGGSSCRLECRRSSTRRVCLHRPRRLVA